MGAPMGQPRAPPPHCTPTVLSAPSTSGQEPRDTASSWGQARGEGRPSNHCASSGRGCIRAGKSPQASRRQGDAQGPKAKGAALGSGGASARRSAQVRSQRWGRGGPADAPRRWGTARHVSGWEGVSGAGCLTPSPSQQGESYPPERWGVGITCRRHANTGPRLASTATGSRGEGCTASTCSIYNAITASAQAVQSATGCKNSLSREQESQQEEGGRNGREGGRGGCRRRHRHRRKSKMETGTRDGG